MKKTQIYFDKETLKWLDEESKRTELKKSEIIRRALDEYRRKEGGK